ncbi:glycosyltransferase family 2 protein [Pseudothermotoga thermarum]|uniref:Glycosyl transferase family 2 n=1 Tax=Pseudothermotoga thermarum DSM 5069 TaxID=688269 RepID=F7YXA5_9THEM|nr:glycosyltransferase family 2 protein [Pseudothermotoga thermarum]AEH51409.1 glycosyl transferase family 2 [Pseudothermotoga thermarum DSM 5069]
MGLLSVAMIVKNEEHNLERALNSIKDVVDEIVIVDTGSTDRTVEIAKKYTDKVYFHPWKNDFSEARNNSLKYPTCEWVLIFDADEEASEEFRKNIRQFLQSLPKDVNTVYLPTISYLDWDFQRTEVASTARIFRNGTVYYENIVHNQAIYKPKVVNANFPIIHYGYIWTRKLKKQKYDRTATLIREQLKGCKSEGEKLYYLVQLYKTEKTGGPKHLAAQVGYETYLLLRKVSKIPAIALEFAYIFGLELATAGLYDMAQELLELTIRVVPEYPDPYYGMLFLSYKRQEWEKLLEWRRRFIEKTEEASKNVEKFSWTIMSFKELGTADLFGCLAALKLDDYEKFNQIALNLISQDAPAANQAIVQVVLDEVAAKDIAKAVDGLKAILQYCLKNKMAVKVDGLLEKIAEKKVEFDLSLLLQFNLSSFSKLVLERMQTGKDLLLKFINNGDLLDIVQKEKIRGLIFVYSLLEDSEKESFLRNLTEHVEQDVLGCVHALLGDLYLKQSKFLDAIRNYRKAIELLPELHKFIKPVTDDLKTRLDPTIEGVYDELYKFYTENLELPIDVGKYCQNKADKLYLLSDSDIAYYVSAINTKDDEKRIELLQKVKDIEKFPMYYYRLAKSYEKKDKKKAFELHIKAVEHNERLGDISFGVYSFTGLYPNSVFSWMKEDDEIVWVGNISERFSGLGVIHPVRAWKMSKEGFIYALPYPSNDALKEYKRREKQSYKTLSVSVKKQDLYELLSKFGWEDLKEFENHQEYESVMKELGIVVDEKSDNQVLLLNINEEFDFEKLLKGKNVLLLHVFPDLSNEQDPTWFYPAFRLFWTLPALKKKLKNLGYEVVENGICQSGLRYVLAKL